VVETPTEKKEEELLNKCNPYHNRDIMINNIPYLRDKISTFIVLSAAIFLLASPLLSFNILLQPAQAQSTLSFRTTQTGADGSCAQMTMLR
jgi:hypothetical protein